MFNYDEEYIRERMREVEREARAYEVARRCIDMKKTQRKTFWEHFKKIFRRA